MRKKILQTCLAAVLICAMLPVTAAFAENATVTGSDVNMRYGPGTGYDIIDCLPKGAEVIVNDRSNSTWYAVSYNGQDGYMSSRYLSIEEEEVHEITESDSADGFINAMYVNFRSAPSSSSSILGQYNKGKIVVVNGFSGDWAYVTIDGEDGYIFRSYVTSGFAASTIVNYEYSGGEVDEDPTPTPEPTPESAPDPASESIPESTPEPAPQPEEQLYEGQPEEAETVQPEIPSDSYRGHITGDYVRFRTGPSTSYTIIDSYNKGKELAAISQDGDWIKAVIDGREGYVFAQYVYIDENPDISDILSLAPQEQIFGGAPQSEVYEEPQVEEVEVSDGYITGNDVRFRSGPSMSSDILGTFYYGNNVTITGVSGDWTAVDYNGRSGFVYSQYVKSGSFSVSGGDPDTPEESSGSVTGRQIADFALQYVGYNYCWGGTSPDTGFDCSGLVYYTYQHFGYTLNRVAADQANNGRAVSPGELKPGDILCFYSSGSYIGHSGIYIGDGMFVHASNSTTGVIITPLDGYYSTRGYEARRIIG